MNKGFPLSDPRAVFEGASPLTPEQSAQLARENIARLQAFKAAPPPPPLPPPPRRGYKPAPVKPQDHTPAPLFVSMGVLAGVPSNRRERKHAANAARIQAKYAREWEPVRMVSIAPPPIPSLLDSSK